MCACGNADVRANMVCLRMLAEMTDCGNRVGGACEARWWLLAGGA